MRVAICCLIRRGNKYVREWIEHHKSIGIDHIFLYDNNRDGEEDLLSEIKDFVVDGFVTIVEWKTDKGFYQNTAQYDCYHNRGKEYDWVAFIDSDEYLQVESGDIHNLVEQDIFQDIDSIQVSTINHTDTGLLTNKSNRRLGVFTEVTWNENQMWYKGIMRTGNPAIEEFNHYPISKHGAEFKLLDADGRDVPATTFIVHSTESAYIDHFPTGCMEDYFYRKHICRWPDENNKNTFDLEQFYYYNDQTEEKDKYWEKLVNGKESMKKKLIFFIYIGDKKSPQERIAENKTAAVHFHSLKKYRKVFDEARFVLSFSEDLIGDSVLLGEYISFINSLGYTENTEFVVEKNTTLRESKTFEYEVLHNGENDGKLIFFGHLRGEAHDCDSVRKWVFSNYYFALSDIAQVEGWLCGDTKVFFGFPMADCRNPNRNPWEVVPKYGYYFLGSEFWINTYTLKEVIRINKETLPAVFGRFYSENFPATVCDYERTATYNFTATMTGYWLYEQFDDMLHEWSLRSGFDRQQFYDEYEKIFE